MNRGRTEGGSLQPGWYLAVDLDCDSCMRIAEIIAEQAGGRLSVIDLNVTATRRLLNEVFPSGWRRAPYLVKAGREQTEAWTRIGGAVRLGRLLGPVGSTRVILGLVSRAKRRRSI